MKDLKLDKESLTSLNFNQIESIIGGENSDEPTWPSCKKKSCGRGDDEPDF